METAESLGRVYIYIYIYIYQTFIQKEKIDYTTARKLI